MIHNYRYVTLSALINLLNEIIKNVLAMSNGVIYYDSVKKYI